MAASPLELQTVEWEKNSATIPLVGQEIMDLQTEVWAVLVCTSCPSSVFFLLCAVMRMRRLQREEEHFSVLFHGVLSAHPLVCVISGTGGRFSCYVIISSCNEHHSNSIHVMFTDEMDPLFVPIGHWCPDVKHREAPCILGSIHFLTSIPKVKRRCGESSSPSPPPSSMSPTPGVLQDNKNSVSRTFLQSSSSGLKH